MNDVNILNLIGRTKALFVDDILHQQKQLQEIEISYATEKQRVESIDENIQTIRDRINKQKEEISKSEENKKELLNSKELDEKEMAKISKENEEKQAIIDEFASSNKDKSM